VIGPPQKFSGLGYSHPPSNLSKNGINPELYWIRANRCRNDFPVRHEEEELKTYQSKSTKVY
jgi:hypothetical protein